MRHAASLIALLLLAGTGSAQDTSAIESVYQVQYTIESGVQLEPEQAFDHPAITALSTQEALSSLDVVGHGQSLHVKVTFHFGSMAAFQRWYAADETRALLRLVGENAARRGHLAVVRIQ